MMAPKWFLAFCLFLCAHSGSVRAQEVNQERDERFVLHNTWFGSVGGFHVVDAGSAPKGTFRLQLGVDVFSTRDFLVQDDEHDHVGGSLSFSWTPLSFLELNAAVLGASNTNNKEDPALFQVIGDVHVGIKAFHNILPWLIVGGDVGTTLLNSVGDIGIDLAATSFAFRGNLSTDFRRLPQPIPLLARLGVQYQLDNSSKLIEDVEAARFDQLQDAPTDSDYETRHLVSTVERYALNINRVDKLNVSLGAEAPLPITDDFTISPIAEWQLGIPINRQGYSCPFVAEPGSPSTPASQDDSCLDQEGFAAFPMVLTLGAKFLPPVKGFSVFAGVDIGLQGTSNFVRELAPVAPYAVLMGASYAYDTRETEPTIIERERIVDLNDTGARVRGVVVAGDSNTPIAGAKVHFTGLPFNDLLTDDAGRFASDVLPQGTQRLQLSAPNVESAVCVVPIPSGKKIVQARCIMKPAKSIANVIVSVVDDKGMPVSDALVALEARGGASTAEDLKTDSKGTVSVTRAPGEYVLLVHAPDYLMKQQPVSVNAQGNSEIKVVLTTKPKDPSVRVVNDKLVLRRQIHFESGKTEVSIDSTQLMEEIADALLRDPGIARMEIQGHTDNVGAAAFNLNLSERRAQAIRNWLIEKAGIDADRLVARGYGMNVPLVPNITPANRARNRRVQFVILERSGKPSGAPTEANPPSPATP